MKEALYSRLFISMTIKHTTTRIATAEFFLMPPRKLHGPEDLDEQETGKIKKTG